MSQKVTHRITGYLVSTDNIIVLNYYFNLTKKSNNTGGL